MTELSARRSATRDRLLDAAVAVFADKGVLGASIEEICEAAGFTRGAFYSNFESKDDLCLALLGHMADGILAATREAVGTLARADAADASPAQLDDVLASAVSAFLAFQPGGRQSVLARAELRLHAVRSEALRVGYRKFLQRVTSTFGEIIEQAALGAGYRLVAPGHDVITVLQAVFEHHAIGQLIDPDSASESVRMLSGVLRSFLVRV